MVESLCEREGGGRLCLIDNHDIVVYQGWLYRHVAVIDRLQ
jgi:hypothetical protein